MLCAPAHGFHCGGNPYNEHCSCADRQAGRQAGPLLQYTHNNLVQALSSQSCLTSVGLSPPGEGRHRQAHAPVEFGGGGEGPQLCSSLFAACQLLVSSSSAARQQLVSCSSAALQHAGWAQPWSALTGQSRGHVAAPGAEAAAEGGMWQVVAGAPHVKAGGRAGDGTRRSCRGRTRPPRSGLAAACSGAGAAAARAGEAACLVKADGLAAVRRHT